MAEEASQSSFLKNASQARALSPATASSIVLSPAIASSISTNENKLRVAETD